MRKVVLFGRELEYELNDNGCWIIKSHIPKTDGYCTIQINRKAIFIHRLSYSFFIGKIKSNNIVRHTCDNPSCFNPNHLVQGTKKDNSQDMVDRCRQGDWEDRNGHRSKLTKQQYYEIVQSKLSSYQLAKVYPVSSTQIRRIRNGSRGYAGSGKLCIQTQKVLESI